MVRITMQKTSPIVTNQWKQMVTKQTNKIFSQQPSFRQSPNKNNQFVFFHSSTFVNANSKWVDPAIEKYKFWNRETSKEKGKFSYLIEISPESIKKEARIVALSDKNIDDANQKLINGPLPTCSSLVGVGTTMKDFDSLLSKDSDKLPPNVLLVSPTCPEAAIQLPLVLEAFPTIEWIHVRSAGIDFIVSDELNNVLNRNKNRVMTNAKGQFSSTLAEYALLACSYFAKDIPRIRSNQKKKIWEPFHVEELRGKTLGIVGYGDIGKACAKMASHYGMRIVALRRRPYLSLSQQGNTVTDPYCDAIYGTSKENLNQLMSESDYIICSAPSTIETRGMVNADAFANVKKNAVFINLGRGPVVDETALLNALKTKRLKGAALDVFIEEPLPVDNELWDMDNVLITPHTMDQTSTFMHEATDFFLNENLPRFLCGEELLNPVDPTLGY